MQQFHHHHHQQIKRSTPHVLTISVLGLIRYKTLHPQTPKEAAEEEARAFAVNNKRHWRRRFRSNNSSKCKHSSCCIAASLSSSSSLFLFKRTKRKFHNVSLTFLFAFPPWHFVCFKQQRKSSIGKEWSFMSFFVRVSLYLEGSIN